MMVGRGGRGGVLGPPPGRTAAGWKPAPREGYGERGNGGRQESCPTMTGWKPVPQRRPNGGNADGDSRDHGRGGVQQNWTPLTRTSNATSIDTAATAAGTVRTTTPPPRGGTRRTPPTPIDALHEADAETTTAISELPPCFCWAKGDGKALVAGSHQPLLSGTGRNYILATPSATGADVLFREVARIIRHSPRIREVGALESSQDQSCPQDRRGRQVLTTPDRGPACSRQAAEAMDHANSVIASDEAHRAVDSEPFSYLKSQAGAKNALMAVSSQAGPPDQSNPIYQVKCASEHEDPEVSGGVLFLYHDAPRTPWGKQQAARDRGTDSPPLWELKWRNRWGSKGQRLLDPADVDACVVDYLPPSNWADVYRLLSTLGTEAEAMGAGLDRSLGYMRLNAGTGDDSVWTTAVRTTNRPANYVLVQFEILGTEHSREELLAMTEKQRSELAKLEVIAAAQRSALLGNRAATLEQYQAMDLVGEVPLDDVVLRPMSTPRKHALYNLLYQLVTHRRLVISSYWPQLIAELKALTVDTSGTTPKYEAKPHDDAIDGLLNALDGILPTEDEDAPEEQDVMSLEEMAPQFQRGPGAAGHGRYGGDRTCGRNRCAQEQRRSTATGSRQDETAVWTTTAQETTGRGTTPLPPRPTTANAGRPRDGDQVAVATDPTSNDGRKHSPGG